MAFLSIVGSSSIAAATKDRLPCQTFSWLADVTPSTLRRQREIGPRAEPPLDRDIVRGSVRRLRCPAGDRRQPIRRRRLHCTDPRGRSCPVAHGHRDRPPSPGCRSSDRGVCRSGEGTAVPQITAKPVEFPQHQRVAGLDRLETGSKAGPVVTAARGQVLVDAGGIDAGGEHRVPLRRERLAAGTSRRERSR